MSDLVDELESCIVQRKVFKHLVSGILYHSFCSVTRIGLANAMYDFLTSNYKILAGFSIEREWFERSRDLLGYS